MVLNDVAEIIKLLGGVAGALTAIIAFVALVSKKPKQWFRDTIREEAHNANKEVKQQIKELSERADIRLGEIEDRIKATEENDIAVLRNTITHIYFKYKDTKKIPHYEKENLLGLYERYEQLHGNQYIKSIMKEMEAWDEIV